MKPTSKKDYPFVVECENQEKTNAVLNYYDNNNDKWEYWKYVVIKCDSVNDIFDDEDYLIKEYGELPKISYSEWVKLPDYAPEKVALKEFVLPEKWCIYNTGKQEIVDFFNENGAIPPYYIGMQNYFHFPPFEYYGKITTSEKIQDGYSEITFDQFKEHVLGIKNKIGDDLICREPKKIIGYKLLKPEYEEAATKIAFTGVQNTFHNFKSGVHFYKGSAVYSRLKEAGVLDLWFEPVYEEPTKEEKILNLLASHGLNVNPEYVKDIINIVNGK